MSENNTHQNCSECNDISTKLKAPFPEKEISWKVQSVTKDRKSALVVPFLSATAVRDRLTEVFGPFGWQCRYFHVPGKRDGEQPGEFVGGLLCSLLVRDPSSGQWLERVDGSDQTPTEPFKGGITGAFRRAGAAYGIGAYLNEVPQTWVKFGEKGDNWTKDGYWDTPKMPAAFLPAKAVKSDERAVARPQKAAPPTRRGENGDDHRIEKGRKIWRQIKDAGEKGSETYLAVCKNELESLNDCGDLTAEAYNSSKTLLDLYMAKDDSEGAWVMQEILNRFADGKYSAKVRDALLKVGEGVVKKFGLNIEVGV